MLRAVILTSRRNCVSTGTALSRRHFKIYTRTGDGGSSMLFNGERRRKDDPIFSALGDTDELNAALGVARAQCESVVARSPAVRTLADILPQLDSVQSRLLDIGSCIATPINENSSEAKLKQTAFDHKGDLTSQLEAWMDAMDTDLLPLRSFILPSGGMASASFHQARAICRRAERSVVLLCLNGDCDRSAAVYLNRLSDYLFVAARFLAKHCGRRDVIYKKSTSTEL